MGTIEDHRTPSNRSNWMPWRNGLYLHGLYLLLVALLLTSCKEDATVQPPAGSGNTSPFTEIVNGTYIYGCNGYCLDEISVASGSIVFLESSLDTMQYAPRLKRTDISQQEWSEILDAIDLEEFEALDSVTTRVGSTASIGNEWLEIRTRDTRKLISFSYGDPVPEFQALLTKMRTIRNRLKS